MRWCVIVIALAACGSKPPAPDAIPRQLDLDVTVGAYGIHIFTNGSAEDGCSSAINQFPKLGQLVTWGDTRCAAGCLEEMTIETGGQRLSIRPPLDWFAQVDVTQSPDAVLSIVGCGGEARIPIGGLPAPSAAITVTRMDATRQIAVSWTSSPAPPTSLVVFSARLWEDVAHVETTSYTYDLQSWEQPDVFNQVSLWAFSEVRVAESPFGPIRIWPAHEAFAFVPMMAQ